MEWKTIKWLNLSKNKVSYTNGQKKSYSYMLTFATIILWLEFYATNRVVTKGRGPGISPGYSEHGPRLLSSLN